MDAKHIFVFKDAFNPDEEVTGGARGLQTKYGPRSCSLTTLWIDGQGNAVTPGGHSETHDGNAGNTFPNRVGVYLITHANNPFVLAGANGVATMICDYLDSRDDLPIDCTMLDKLVFVTCAGSDNIKHKYYVKEELAKVNRHVQKQDRFYKDYTAAAKSWDEQRQQELDSAATKYEQDSDTYLKSDGNMMVLLACALDKRGARPRIAAWDGSLYVRDDGRKSIHSQHGNPVQRHQRLLNKMMIQFTRSDSGGSIVQLPLQDWSDKPLNLPK